MIAIKPKRKAAVKNRLAADIKYEKFEVLANIIEGFDPEWAYILREFARGYFPKDFTYNEPYIIYKGKNSKSKNNSFDTREIDISDIDSLFVFIEFFKTNGDVETSKDIEKSEDEAERIRKQLSEYTLIWDKLNSKNKKNLISLYIDSQALKYNLSYFDKQEYLAWLNQMFAEKKIDKGDVTIENNRISEIKGEGWDPETNSPFLEFRNIKSTKSYAKVKTTTSENSGICFNKLLADFSKRQKDKVKYLI